MQTGMLALPTARNSGLRPWDAADRSFYQFNPVVAQSAGGDVQTFLPVFHAAEYLTYLCLGGGGVAGQELVAGSAAGGGGSGALVAACFRRPFPFDRVEAQIGRGNTGGTSQQLRNGGDSILVFYRYGVELLRLTAGGGKGSLDNSGGAGGAGGVPAITRGPGVRVPQLLRNVPAADMISKLELTGVAGENGQSRGNDIGGDGGDGLLGLITRRFGDQKGGLGGLFNNDSATEPSGGIGWGCGSGAGVGAGASGNSKGGAIGLILDRVDLSELLQA